MIVDLGDAELVVNLRLKGNRGGFVVRVGAPRDSDPANRVVTGPPSNTSPGKAAFIMDLAVDKEVDLTGAWTDEMGNVVPAPPDFTATFTNDNPDALNLTDHGDGTALATSVALGTANIHGDAFGNGRPVTADFQIVVVAGDAERFEITAGEPREITPDEPTP